MATKQSGDGTSNGVKLIGEVIVPGASQFIDGNIRSGGIHLLVGAAALAFGGPGGLLLSALVRGNSFTTSTQQKPIYKALIEPGPARTGDSA